MSPRDKFERIKAAWPEIGPPVLNYLRTQLDSEDEARDAAQDTYTLLLAEDPETILDIPSFTFKIATNVALQRRREQARHRRLDSRFSMERRSQTEELSPERVCTAQVEFEVINRAFEELPVPLQMACRAYVEGEAMAAVAQRLGVSTRTAYRHLDRSHEHLAKAVDKPSYGGSDHE